ncbi:helix-turn-helix domain-containing protein [Nocardioides bruguierae]|uniref:Helix-turn-helix domain-containing protein n=1 Tax=Nocardioides bruguierae TaxID=2945102 RepID=A0A9X2DB16_9ACTN|nr:helix-turn-helix domain-containing protein [Nocardioides bruguierae]MCM0622456.1 helix-turn-helix domain-containing protein [Nocardioides bruguierae]MCM0622864.1 helix-turn-helix domain-containing protein [Nocardioides bruguierae]
MDYLFNLDTARQAVDDVDGTVTIKPNVWLLTADDMPPMLFTPEDVARLLHVGRPMVYNLMNSGELRSMKVGRCRRISARALADYVAAMDQDAFQ